MTTDEIREQARRLESEIESRINKFCADTGVQVTAIDLQSLQMIAAQPEYIVANLRLRISL